MAATLAQNVHGVLESAIKAPGGPPGIVFGAVDRTGKVLVNEGAGVRFINKPDQKVGVRRFFFCGKRGIGTMWLTLLFVPLCVNCLDDP
jgi:hypothetical protein